MKIDEALLRRLAGDKSYARGLAYARDGAVHIELRRDDQVRASVEGSASYTVCLAWHDGELQGECDCPVGDGLCKHQVATALIWAGTVVVADDELTAHASPGRKKSARGNSADDEQILTEWLAGLTPDALQALLLDLAAHDKDVRRQWLARARFARGASTGRKQAVSDLIGRRRFRDYRETLAYARQLRTLIETMDETRQRTPADALELSDYALQRLFSNYAESDDSTGALGEVLGAVAEIYRHAAHAARPQPEAFAKAYFKLRGADGWSIIGEVGTYAEVLGRPGLAALEKSAHAALAALPAQGDEQHWDEHAGQRWQLFRMLEELARHGGDLDALLALKVRALRQPHDYLELARLCNEHHREKQAIDWLDRGLRAHPKDDRLLATQAENYIREGFPDDALKLLWRLYETQPDEASFLLLRKHTLASGHWPAWRQRAYALIEGSKTQLFGQSQLVTLHLADDDLATAWTLAQRSELSSSLWVRLGKAMESTQPENALHAYRIVVKESLMRTSKSGYAEAIKWLKHLQPLHRRLGSLPAFTAYLAQLRETHRAKRSFIAMLGDFGKHAAD